MNKKLTSPIPMSLAIFVIALSAAALLGSVGTLLIGILGSLLAIVVAAIAGFSWVQVQAILEAKKKGATTVAEQPSGPTVVPPDRLDPLTGLANLNGLNAWFSEKAARLAQDNKAIIVLTADLANFDQLVRAKGVDQANSVLKEAAKRVASFTGDDGIAARIDGDEFAAIATVVPSHSLDLAAEQAGKLTEMLQRPVELPTGVVWIGGSVGAATGSPLEGAAVFEKAKQALKKAKQMGRGHYFVDGLADKKE